MKIIAFCPYYPPHTGGLEKYAYDLHKNLSKLGHQITVFTPHLPPHSGFTNSKSVEVITFPAWEIIYNYPLPKVWSIHFWSLLFGLRKNKYDLTLSYTRFFITSLFALVFSKLQKTPWAHVEHGSDFVTSKNIFIKYTARLVDETLGRLTFKFSNINIAPSKSARQFILRFDQRPTPVIYRGLNHQELSHVSSEPQVSQKFPNQTIITFLGRFIEGKGIPDLIKTVSLIKNDSWALLLIGDGSQKPNIVKITNTSNISQQTLFVGDVTHAQAISFLKASDIIVNPSYNEGLPTTILEAAACSKAIIATNVGGTPEIIEHNKSGLLYEPGDTQTLYQHLTRLISNPEIRRLLGQSAYLSSQRKFNWTNTVNQYSSIFSQLINS
jgi:glycosyltransferase involved in cell wall biosynthesis